MAAKQLNCSPHILFCLIIQIVLWIYCVTGRQDSEAYGILEQSGSGCHENYQSFVLGINRAISVTGKIWSSKRKTNGPCNTTSSPQFRSLCYNDCQLSVRMDGRTLDYDFSALANTTSFLGGPSFTSKGMKYFHHFNISLCGNHVSKLSIYLSIDL